MKNTRPAMNALVAMADTKGPTEDYINPSLRICFQTQAFDFT
jgi:hypothetical protein